MQARNWLLMVAGLVAAGVCLVVGLNVIIDPYGLYRDTHRRKLPAYGDPRISKYLLGSRYVVENFNSILIGSSISANWEMSGVEKLKIYNDSLNGGNIVEEKALVEQALSRPGISVAFLIVNPYLTHAHNMQTVKLEPSLRYSGLGSESLLDAYKDMLRVRLRHSFASINPAGTERLDILPSQLNPTLRELLRPGPAFDVDPVALSAYREVVAALRAHHVQFIFVVPPIFEDLLLAKQDAFRAYAQLIESSMSSGDLLIDFTLEEFSAFRRNRANFGDGVHLFTKPAAEVVSMINTQVDTWIEQGRLRQPPEPR